MKKIITLFLLVFGILLFQNAKSYSMGLFYTDANYPVTATGVKVNDLSELKEGKSEAINVLWVVEVGDAGVDKAAKNGNIKKISYIDVREKTVFIFFKKITTTVYGE